MHSVKHAQVHSSVPPFSPGVRHAVPCIRSLSISCTTGYPAIHTSTVHMQVKGHKSKNKKQKLEDTSTSDRSVLIIDNGEMQCGDDVTLWICTDYLLCHCCFVSMPSLLCNAVRHLQILMIPNPNILRAGTAASWNQDDNHRIFHCR